MDLDKFREQIERYLEQAEYINVLIKKEEVEKDETERYLALLAILGEKREFADKFYERMTISFEGYDRDLFSNSALSALRDFLHKQNMSPVLLLLKSKCFSSHSPLPVLLLTTQRYE